MVAAAGRAAEGPPPPCPRVTRVTDQLCVGGLGGGLTSEAIEVVLQEYAVTHLVVCGHKGADAHVAAAEGAAQACGAEVHVSPLVPADASQLAALLDQARAFVAAALSDDLNCVLVACSKGASRSVAVVLAHLMAALDLGLEDAFDLVARLRWRVWPSALLVEGLLGVGDRLAQERGRAPLGERGRASAARRVGLHAAWATAWHNGQEADFAAAGRAWDSACAQGGPLEDVFRKCKQSLMGLEGVDIAAFHAAGRGAGRPAHAQPTEVTEGLLLAGLGGLPPADVAAFLREHRVCRAVVCGRRDRDRHVSALVNAMDTCGSVGDGAAQGAACHVVPIADSASEDLFSHLQVATAFIREAMAKRGQGTVLVACRQGASRSASVVIAHLMSEQKLTVSEAFRLVAAKRWRIWPNAGFVEQLLRLADERGGPPATTAQRSATLRLVGVHAAWAANRQNLEETGVGRAGLSLEDVGRIWDGEAASSQPPEELFERCKALALGVDLSAFEGSQAELGASCEGDGTPGAAGAAGSKRLRTS